MPEMAARTLQFRLLPRKRQRAIDVLQEAHLNLCGNMRVKAACRYRLVVELWKRQMHKTGRKAVFRVIGFTPPRS